MTTSDETTDEYGETYTDYQRNRSALRRMMRRPWLRAAAGFVSGPTVDLGCGVGELLVRLPEGSIGLEINRATVAHCQAEGLDVSYYDGTEDDWSLGPVRGRDTAFESLVMSHVLEHLDEPMDVLRRVLRGAEGAGIRRVLVQVPGPAGYRTDDTHRTFVDQPMLVDPGVTQGTSFALDRSSYFPGNVRRIGDWFVYHELRALYMRP